MARLIEASVDEGFWRTNTAHNNFRNASLDNERVDLGNPFTFDLPLSGIIKFDYVSLKQVFAQRKPALPWAKERAVVSDFAFFQLTEVLLLLITLEAKEPSADAAENDTLESSNCKQHSFKADRLVQHEALNADCRITLSHDSLGIFLIR